MDLYIYSPIRLHGVKHRDNFNYLNICNLKVSDNGILKQILMFKVLSIFLNVLV
jgi:hypothetical protein